MVSKQTTNPSADATTFDLSQTCLQLKAGLRFSIQHGRNDSWFLLEDKTRSAFFRLGAPEYTLISKLDGKTNIATAVASTCMTLGADALSEQDAIQLCRWLVDSNLAHTDASTSASRLSEQREKLTSQKALSKLDPIAIKFPLMPLDGIATFLNDFFGFLVSKAFMAIWIITVLAGMLCITFSSNSHVELISKDNLFWMVVTWLVLKTVHEAAHVLTCKSFGGTVGRGGILFLLLIPMPFVDVTSAWRFPNKYQRILTSAAGMLAEIFIAAIAAMFWAFSGPGPVQFHAANIMLAASLHTLLFNANPLMRFDGYHMLADWLELPNLGNHAQKWVKACFSRLFFGTPPSDLEYGGWQRRVIKLYGVLALAWRIALCLVLGFAAANLFYGIGLMVAMMACALWLGIPCYKLAKFIVIGNGPQKPNRIQFISVCSVIALVILAAGRYLPGPTQLSAPMVVEFESSEIVRPISPGFVKTICCAENDQVIEGDVLFVLANPDLVAQIKIAKLDLEAEKYRVDQLQNVDRFAESHAQQGKVKYIEKRLAELEIQLQGLNVRSPISGIVIGGSIDSWLGEYVKAGQEIIEVGNPERKRIVGLLAQKDADALSKLTDNPVSVEIWGRDGAEVGLIQNVLPRSVDAVPHFSFAAVNGGPLDVVKRSDMESNDDESEMMLVKPHIELHVAVKNAVGEKLLAGQMGRILVRGQQSCLSDYVIDQTVGWVKSQIKHSHGF